MASEGLYLTYWLSYFKPLTTMIQIHPVQCLHSQTVPTDLTCNPPQSGQMHISFRDDAMVPEHGGLNAKCVSRVINPAAIQCCFTNADSDGVNNDNGE